jgi:hypothetical protein
MRKRSLAMAVQLPALLAEIDVLRAKLSADPAHKHGPYAPEAARLASDTARLLIQEVLDWRVVFLDRPLTRPS